MKHLVLFALCLLAMSFIPANQKQIFPTKLEIIIRNDLGNLVEGASVQLFKTQEDYDKGEKPVTEIKKTDAKGKVVFSDLETVAYYVQAEKGDMSNQGAGAKTIPLVAKKMNKITIIISE
ncbi:MAG: hypothetical protein V4714_10540 [Bacteroidota bacterium]